MKRLIKLTRYLLTLIICLLLAGAYLSRIIDPGDFWPLSFLGLMFPVILAIAVVYTIFLAVKLRKSAVLMAVVLLAGWNPIRQTVQLFSQKKDTENKTALRIMSYNVRIFDSFKWSGVENNGRMLLDFIAGQKPDIICLQEFMVNSSGDFDLPSINKSLDFAPYNHMKYISEGRIRKVGLAIFSKYPIINAGGDKLEGLDRLFIYTDIKVGSDTLRLFNIHLESIHLNQKQINLIDSLMAANPMSRKKEYLGIMRNMKSSYITRAGQAQRIADEISNSPYPVIVSGDFNDTPVSYAYRLISKDLNDAFVSSGQGMGASYREFALPLRIDYLLHDREITSSGFKAHNVKFSDHRPIEATLWLNGPERE